MYQKMLFSCYLVIFINFSFQFSSKNRYISFSLFHIVLLHHKLDITIDE